jgi:hypothetical protein
MADNYQIGTEKNLIKKGSYWLNDNGTPYDGIKQSLK